MTEKIDLTLLLCTYNEEKRISEAIKQVLSSLKNVKFVYEIIFIDNNSTDQTSYKIAENIKINNNCKLLVNEKNIGKGGSIKKGINLSKGKYVMIFDPDLEYESNDIVRMFDKIKLSKYDFIIGSRRLNKKFNFSNLYKDKNKGLTYILNYLGVFLLTLMINILYKQNITDSASALKIFNSEFIKKVKLKRNGFNLDFELICKTAISNGKITEIPINYYPRSKQEGKKIKAVKDGSSSFLAILIDRFF